MKNLSNETVQELTNQLDNLNFNLEELNRALNRTDDFTNWSYAEIFGSIATSLVKMNAIENTKLVNNKGDKKMSRREFLGLNNK